MTNPISINSLPTKECQFMGECKDKVPLVSDRFNTDYLVHLLRICQTHFYTYCRDEEVYCEEERIDGARFSLILREMADSLQEFGEGE